MKKALVAVLVLMVLALNFAALNDITTGNEPDYALEYLFLLVSLTFFLALGAFYVKQKKTNYA